MEVTVGPMLVTESCLVTLNHRPVRQQGKGAAG